MLSKTFNTTQFRDISTDDQIDNGITMFEDLNNPGDYYIESESGNVYRMNRTRIITNANGNFDVNVEETRYCINPRVINRGDDRSRGYMKLGNRIDRLSRIQYSSNRRATKGRRLSSVYNNVKHTYIPQ